MTYEQVLRMTEDLRIPAKVEWKEYFDMVIDAVKKQIPQSPAIVHKTINHEFYDSVEVEHKDENVCPCCGNVVLQYCKRNDFCNKCGQAIKF